MPAAILYDEMFLEHVASGYHPERPERLGAIISGLRTAGAWNNAIRIAPRPAATEELTRVHDAGYVDGVLEAIAGSAGHLDPDTFFSAGSRDAALNAAGGGVDLALEVGFFVGCFIRS